MSILFVILVFHCSGERFCGTMMIMEIIRPVFADHI